MILGYVLISSAWMLFLGWVMQQSYNEVVSDQEGAGIVGGTVVCWAIGFTGLSTAVAILTGAL